jgi:hypothetical protein
MSTANVNRIALITFCILVLSTCADYKIELLVSSGTENPVATISESEYKILEKHIEGNKHTVSASTTRVMGYKGFLVLTTGIHLQGFKDAELYLLTFFVDMIPSYVYHHILETMNREYVIGYNQLGLHESINDQCDNIPIRGVDGYPTYNPDKDDLGCFEDRQTNNNCYNYGTDVVTNTFAQPGRGTGHKWESNTCDSMKVAAVSDGLVFMGTDFSKKLDDGHYVALLIWPDYNFHWVRLDVDGHWSHKPGGTEVRNTDNNGNLITDPSKQDFSPWSQFCAYFAVIPSKVTIN